MKYYEILSKWLHLDPSVRSPTTMSPLTCDVNENARYPLTNLITYNAQFYYVWLFHSVYLVNFFVHESSNVTENIK